MAETVNLTDYQFRCLRLAYLRGRHLMLEHENSLKKLVASGFVETDPVAFGTVWIRSKPAGEEYLRRMSAL